MRSKLFQNEMMLHVLQKFIGYKLKRGEQGDGDDLSEEFVSLALLDG